MTVKDSIICFCLTEQKSEKLQCISCIILIRLLTVSVGESISTCERVNNLLFLRCGI